MYFLSVTFTERHLLISPTQCPHAGYQEDKDFQMKIKIVFQGKVQCTKKVIQKAVCNSICYFNLSNFITNQNYAYQKIEC